MASLVGREVGIIMEFKIRYLRELITTLFVAPLALYVLELNGHRGLPINKFVAISLILMFLLIRYYLTRYKGYIIKDDKIIIRDLKNTYFKISKIKHISQMWVSSSSFKRTNKVQYFIVFHGSNNRLEIDLSYRNSQGQSLVTVLEKEYGIKVNRIV
jgi:hypothetical protein